MFFKHMLFYKMFFPVFTEARGWTWAMWHESFTAWSTVISRNFLLWKFCDNTQFPQKLHCVKSVQIKSYFKSVFSCIRTRNKYAFSYFSCSARATYPKLCRHCAFPQNFHVIKLGEISVFYVVIFKLAKAFTYNKEFNTSRVKEVITFLWNR